MTAGSVSWLSEDRGRRGHPRKEHGMAISHDSATQGLGTVLRVGSPSYNVPVLYLLPPAGT